MPVLKYRNANGNYVAIDNNRIAPYAFDGTYNATSNKIALVSSITSRMPSNLPAAENGTDTTLVTTGDKYTWNSEYTYNNGVNTAQNITSLQTNKRVVITSPVTSDSTLGFAANNTIAAGRELQILVTGTAGKTITFPSTGVVKMTGDTVTLDENGYCEINIISDGTNYYIRAIGA